MSGEGLLLGMAQIAIVTAGFASLASALRRESGTWTSWHGVRLRGLVTSSLSATMLSLLPLLLYAVTADEQISFTVASGVMAAYIATIMIVRERQMLRARVARGRLNVFLLSAFIAILAISISNVVWWRSLGGFAVSVSIELLMAFLLFYTLLAESSTSRD